MTTPMHIYGVTNRDTNTVHRIRTYSDQNASVIAFCREYGRKRNLFANRTTGIYPYSGIFQIYQSGREPECAAAAVGPTHGYHVAERSE